MSSVMEYDSGFYTFTWCIRNSSFCHEIKGYCHTSPNFVMETCGETEWELEVYPNGHNADGFVACDLRLLSKIFITATSTLSIVGADGFSYFSVERINQKFPVDSFSGIENFAKRDEIYANKNVYLPKDTLTIRCEIRRRFTEKPLIKHCGIRSEIGTKHISVPWDIKHFSSLQLKQPFKFPLSLNLEKSPNFEIHFYLDGNFLDSSHVQIDIMKISLSKEARGCALETHGRRITMCCEISVLDSKGIPSLTIEGMRFFDSSVSDVLWKLPELAKRIDLRCKKSLYLPDDVLSLRFEMTVSDGNIQSLPAEVHAIYPESRCVKPSSTMKDDFRLLYKEQKLCDVTLKTASKNFKAHKAVLACRSPVFQAMFEHDMVENSSGIVNISDVDSKTLDHMLFYIYADQLKEDLDPRSCMELYSAADKYQINSLKESCYPILKNLVSAENVCEVLSLAFKYHDDPLKIIAKAFICKHPNETMESGMWERLLEEKWSEPGLASLTAQCPEGSPIDFVPAVAISLFAISDTGSDEDGSMNPKKKLKV